MNGNHRGSGTVAVSNHTCVGHPVGVVAKVTLLLVGMNRLERAIESHYLAHPVVGFETGKPSPWLDSYLHPRRRLVEEACGIARFCHLGVEADALHGPPKLDGVEAERDRRRAHHRAEDRPHNVIECGCGSNLNAISTRKIERLGSSGEVVLEMLPPMAAWHQRCRPFARFVHNSRHHRGVFHA